MLPRSFLLSLGTLAVVQGIDAPVINNNVAGTTYEAVLPGTSVEGSVRAVAAADGTGVNYQVSFSGLPTSGGPFPYHIHQAPVPVDGNCTGTLAHLDPYVRGEQPPCDPATPANCQVGDLSGKYGNVTEDPFEASYLDPYTSTTPGDTAYFGNLSFVVHYANSTRIACANFTLVSSSNGTNGTNGTSTTSTYTVPTPTSSIATGAAVANSFSFGAGLMGLAAMFL